MRALGLSIVTALVVGCTSSQARPEAKSAKGGATRDELAAMAKSITLCKTTEAELRDKLGAPFRDGIVGKMKVISWLASASDTDRFLAIAVDERGVVVDVYWDAPGALDWTLTNHCVS